MLLLHSQIIIKLILITFQIYCFIHTILLHMYTHEVQSNCHIYKWLHWNHIQGFDTKFLRFPSQEYNEYFLFRRKYNYPRPITKILFRPLDSDTPEVCLRNSQYPIKVDPGIIDQWQDFEDFWRSLPPSLTNLLHKLMWYRWHLSSPPPSCLST